MIVARQFTKTASQARVLDLILRLYGTTTVSRDGKPYIAIQLDKVAEMVSLKTRSAVSRILSWLEEQGIIQIVRGRWNRAPRLYIRPLIRTPRHPVGNLTGCAGATSCLNQDKKSNNQDSDAPSGHLGITVNSKSGNSGRMKPSLDGVHDRLKEKQEATRANSRYQKPKPKIVAHSWIRILGEYGYLGFDPNSGHHLKHIDKTILFFGSKTLGEFEVELERRVGLWMEHRPKALGKAPPHPWAINRTDPLFQKLAIASTDEDFAYPELIPDAIIQSPPQVDEAKAGSPDAPDVVGPKSKGGMMHLFKKGKDAK